MDELPGRRLAPQHGLCVRFFQNPARPRVAVEEIWTRVSLQPERRFQVEDYHLVRVLLYQLEPERGDGDSLGHHLNPRVAPLWVPPLRLLAGLLPESVED